MIKQYIKKTSFKEILERASRYTIIFREDEIEDCLPDFIEIKKDVISYEDVKAFLTMFFKSIEESSNPNLGHRYFDLDIIDDESIESDSFLTFSKFCDNVFDKVSGAE